ncbi:hypothetical protein ABN321_20750, partial [Escherichia coli]|uniref:hypothetical protein n=1 Tax=Escherichia coli TaxID=562 RepID=UPI0032DAA43F
MMSLWDALRMNMMISYQELVRTFPNNLGVDTFRANNRSVTFSDGVIQYFSSQCLVFMQAM